jgi:hypothetical protein
MGFYRVIQKLRKLGFDQSVEYWKQTISFTPGNYIEVQNWLKITKRFEFE